MSPSRRRLRNIARGLGIVIVAFFVVLDLDAFQEYDRFWDILAALLIQLVPAAMVLAALWLAWRRPRAGGVLYLALGLLYIGVAWGRFPWYVYALVAGPLLLCGLLFLVVGAAGEETTE